MTAAAFNDALMAAGVRVAGARQRLRGRDHLDVSAEDFEEGLAGMAGIVDGPPARSSN
jgi:hypothetical protein